jgi:hypothetical protein
MKFLSILALASLASGVFAAEDLSAMKNKANSQIDQKMSSLQTAKSCVNSASSVDKFKACKYDMHEKMQKDKMQMMEEKKDEMLNSNQ